MKNFVKIGCVIGATIFLAVTYCRAGEYRLGGVPSPIEEMETLPLAPALSPAEVAELPSSVNLMGELPPVGDQANQGSCAAWAVGYYYKTFQEGKEHGWDLTTENYRFSPAFIYNQLNGGKDEGICILYAMKLIKDKGCSTLDFTPYDYSRSPDYLSWPTMQAFDVAIQYRADSCKTFFWGSPLPGYDYDDPEAWKWRNVPLGDDKVNTMKNHLANGDIFVMGIPVYRGFKKNTTSVGGGWILGITYDTVGTIFIYHEDAGYEFCGLHGVTIVGYDDNLQAFRIRNSWGTDWQVGGDAWISYDFVKKYAIEALAMTDKIGYVPTAKAFIEIDHPARGNLRLDLFYSWVELCNIYRNAGGNEMPNIHTVVDITDWDNYLPPGRYSRWKLKVKDTVPENTGSIEMFKIQYQGKEYIAVDVPVGIEDYETKYSYIPSLNDTSPTTPVVVDDGDYTSPMATELHASWSSQDAETGIQEYQYAIGTTPGGTDVVGWTSLDPTITEVTVTGLSLEIDNTYYFSVKALDFGGLWSDMGYSNGITVKKGGFVWEVSAEATDAHEEVRGFDTGNTQSCLIKFKVKKVLSDAYMAVSENEAETWGFFNPGKLDFILAEVYEIAPFIDDKNVLYN